MNDHTWIRITACDNIPPREGRAVRVGDREIAIFNLGDRFLAVDNRCPHRGGPLCDGIVAGTAVVCPLHAWKVSLETGGVERPADTSTCVRTYPTRVEADVVIVGVPSEPAGREARTCAPARERRGVSGPRERPSRGVGQSPTQGGQAA